MKDLRRGHWSRVVEEETSARKEQWENAFNGRRMDSVQEETLVVSLTEKPRETDAIADADLIQVKEHIHPLLLWRRRPRLTEGSLMRMAVQEEQSPSGLKGRRPCKDFLKGKCAEPSCDLWHPPVCLNRKSESGCKYGDRCHFRHTRGWWAAQ